MRRRPAGGAHPRSALGWRGGASPSRCRRWRSPWWSATSNRISLSLFSPANTLAALLANSFPEAGPKQVTILMYAALVLLGITLIVNVIGAVILQRASRGLEEAR